MILCNPIRTEYKTVKLLLRYFILAQLKEVKALPSQKILGCMAAFRPNVAMRNQPKSS